MGAGNWSWIARDSVDVAETSRCGIPSRLTQFTLVNPSGPRVNWEVRRGDGTDKGDVKSEDLPLNISRETEKLVENCYGKIAGFAGKNDYKKEVLRTVRQALEAWKPQGFDLSDQVNGIVAVRRSEVWR